ncbi:putative sodium/calcium exchanger 7-like isoform 2 protein [Corchorus olitorius]|uniref:Sodium/calcium exchanger 7-like isoform 2 protein n=1 Tax=Corchorus olitorius TaxID=93759 RepID=A0A1R3G4Z4_9ROSI|nr:putative sodium/calcium exchanger 7-like isoform 2 protein [Corchorus olitorius]
MGLEISRLTLPFTPMPNPSSDSSKARRKQVNQGLAALTLITADLSLQSWHLRIETVWEVSLAGVLRWTTRVPEPMTVRHTVSAQPKCTCD